MQSGGYRPPDTPIGGPPSGQFLSVFAQIPQALNTLTTAILQLIGVRATTQIALSPVTPPAAPASGAIIYVSNVDNHTYIVGSGGTRTSIAPP